MCATTLPRRSGAASRRARVRGPSELAQLKFHFWVNGAGIVVRDRLSVPDTVACRSREMELIGAFFVARDRTGRWETFVNLHPRLSLEPNGNLRVRDEASQAHGHRGRSDAGARLGDPEIRSRSRGRVDFAVARSSSP